MASPKLTRRFHSSECFTECLRQANEYVIQSHSEQGGAQLGHGAIRVSDQRTQTIFDGDGSIGKFIQLMNFHQTKGREADVVILVYRDADWFGREREPYPTNSRLLYVSLTRARFRNVVILPPTPHPLVSPFAKLSGAGDPNGP